MGQEIDEIGAMPAAAAAVAVTATFCQMAFASSLGADFPMLSDWEGATARAYGVQYETWKGHRGLAKRSVFVIDREGVIRYRWHTDDAHIEPDLGEAMDVLRALADRA